MTQQSLSAMGTLTFFIFMLSLIQLQRCPRVLKAHHRQVTPVSPLNLITCRLFIRLDLIQLLSPFGCLLLPLLVCFLDVELDELLEQLSQHLVPSLLRFFGRSLVLVVVLDHQVLLFLLTCHVILGWAVVHEKARIVGRSPWAYHAHPIRHGLVSVGTGNSQQCRLLACFPNALGRVLLLLLL